MCTVCNAHHHLNSKVAVTKQNQADISVEIIEQPEEYAKIILAKEKLIIHQKMPIYTT